LSTVSDTPRGYLGARAHALPSGRQDLAELGRERIRLHGPALFAHEEAAVAAREDDRFHAESLRDRLATAARHLAIGLRPDRQHDPRGRRLERGERPLGAGAGA